MKTLPELRFDIDLLSKECLTYVASDMVQLKPDYYISKHHKDFNATVNTLYKRDHRIGTPSTLYTASRVKGNNGWNIYYEMTDMYTVKLIWNKGNMKHIKKGYIYRLVKKPRHNILHLFIKNDGTVLYKTKSQLRTLCLATLQGMMNILSFPIATALLTLKPDKKWLHDLLLISETHSNNPNIEHITVGKNMYDKCSSLQEFIDNINTRDHPISADWFEGVSLRDIVETMALQSDPTPYFHNAMDYFNFIDESGSDFDGPVPSIGATIRRNRQVNVVRGSRRVAFNDMF